MFNSNREIPTSSTNLGYLYSVILAQDSNNSGMVKAVATDPGVFEIKTGSIVLANEPVKTLDIANSISAIKIYFVASFDYEGITQNGSPVTIADGSATVDKDGNTLYSATLSSGSVTIAKIGL